MKNSTLFIRDESQERGKDKEMEINEVRKEKCDRDNVNRREKRDVQMRNEEINRRELMTRREKL